eukprot:1391846-Amorphochlora_amoeboformis.AAC.2
MSWCLNEMLERSKSDMMFGYLNDNAVWHLDVCGAKPRPAIAPGAPFQPEEGHNKYHLLLHVTLHYNALLTLHPFTL